MALPKLNTVTYELELPSTAEKLKYRPFLVKEQKSLMIASESEDDKVIQESIASIISECTFHKVDPWELPSFDVEYIFLRIRGKSVGEKVKLNLLCPDDEKTRVEVNVDLTKVNVEMHVGHSTEIELTDDVKIIMSYPTLKDVGNIGNIDSETEQLFAMLKNCIYQIHEGDTIHQDVDIKEKELDEFIDSLSTEHLEKINTFFETMPKLLHKVKVKNPKTKKTREIVIEGFQSFFV